MSREEIALQITLHAFDTLSAVYSETPVGSAPDKDAFIKTAKTATDFFNIVYDNINLK